MDDEEVQKMYAITDQCRQTLQDLVRFTHKLMSESEEMTEEEQGIFDWWLECLEEAPEAVWRPDPRGMH